MRRPGFVILVLVFAPFALPLHAATVAPDFHLEDVNAGSVRFENTVSPRDYVLQVTGYYFGHAS